MKKGLIGCLIVAVVLLVGGSIAVYYFAKPLVSDYLGGIMELQEVAELNEQIDNQASYTPPADRELSAEQVDRFVDVQQRIRGDLDKEFQQLKAKYESLEAEIKQEGRDANYREILGAWRDVMDLIVDAKRAQVAALNEANFSLEEYEWVRREVYHAAGTPLPNVGVNEIVNAVKEGQDPRSMQQQWAEEGDEVPAQNRELVEAHVEQLKEMEGLAWFGL